MDVEVPNLLPMRLTADAAASLHLLAAQFHAEARADVLSAWLTPLGGGLVEDQVDAERRLEIDVRAAEPFQVEEWREGRHLERVAAVIDAESAVDIGRART